MNLSPAAAAFDSIAGDFDERFSQWLSVRAQRRAVRAALLAAFPPGARLIEIGGGTGEDALWLAQQGREVLLTDASPAMVAAAEAKFAGRPGMHARVAGAEALDRIEGRFDGAYSNFAALNCIADLKPFARGLARLLRLGAPAMLVLFGTYCPGEMLVEALRGRPRNMFRRFSRADVPASLGGRDFTIRYHRTDQLKMAMSPWFEPKGRQAIGLFVPPSAAEPWMSHHPGLLGALEALDRTFSSPLAIFGDHVLFRFERNAVQAE